MKWVNKIKNLWRRLFKKAPSQEEMLEQFLKLISPPKVVNTYKDAIVIQNVIDGDWGDIWDFSLWETKGIIGWTMIDHWESIENDFDPIEYEEPEEAYQLYLDIFKKPKIMIATVYEYENGNYGIDMKNRIDLWFQDGHWYMV